MNRPGSGKSGKEGCFVYKVLTPCGLRSRPSVDDDARIPDSYVFGKGAFVSIDLIKPSDGDSSDGPFLRLSDGSGWLFKRKGSEPMMERVEVETGQWCFYADNFPAGIGLRAHPIDALELLIHPDVTILPMEKLICDIKCTDESSGVNYYRLKGSTGWVFDRRGSMAMLLSEKLIETGSFCYRALHDIIIRNDADVGDSAKIPTKIVNEGECVSVDLIRHSTYPHGNGPFLRLSDGSGWLFQHKFHEMVMEPIAVDEGSWSLNIVSNVGMALRFQPICRDFQTTTIYLKGSTCDCDKRIVTPSGITFYRVKGTNGWIFDKIAKSNVVEAELISPGIFSERNQMSSIDSFWPFSSKRSPVSAAVLQNEVEINTSYSSLETTTPEVKKSIRLSARGFRVNSPANSITSQFSTATQEKIISIKKQTESVDAKLKALRTRE